MIDRWCNTIPSHAASDDHKKEECFPPEEPKNEITQMIPEPTVYF
jgi:hypothetical protein